MGKHKKVIMVMALLIFTFLKIDLVKAAPSIERIYGSDRYKTSIVFSNKKFSKSDNVVLTTGNGFSDSLCAAPLAKKLDAPIILVNSDFSQDIRNEIKRLGAKNVYIIGGTGVIPYSVESGLKDIKLKVERISGTDRYETSVNVAKKLNANDKVFVVLGTNFPDALSVGPVAGRDGIPVILTQKDSIPNVVSEYFKGKSISKSYVIGSSKVIGSSVSSNLPNAERIYGQDRYETNNKVIQKFMNNNFNSVYVASGESFSDALVASVVAGKEGTPIALVGRTMNVSLNSFLKSKLSDNAIVNILGGTSVVSNSAVGSLVSNKPVTPVKPPTPVKPVDVSKDNGKIKVCLDASRGGSDEGETGANGIKEKNINLSLTLKIGKMLSDKGVNVVYTRKEDKDLSDDERVKIAKLNSSNLFISVKCNWYEKPTANGIETLYWSGDTLSQNLTKLIQEQISSKVDLVNRGYKEDTKHSILKDVNMTSALIMCGFISNSNDEEKISNSAFQDILASSIVQGILNYSNNTKPVVTPVVKPGVPIICIDAGHGGYDPGAGGPTGLKEKDVTLAVALKLGKVLSSKGINVVYNRTSDKVPWPSNVSEELRARVGMASKANASYFISIHCNSFGNSANGTETYYSTMNNKNDISNKLAQSIQASLVKELGSFNRGVKTANYYVNKNATSPSILTELGFISNPKEESLLRSDSYQQRCADAIARGILSVIGK